MIRSSESCGILCVFWLFWHSIYYTMMLLTNSLDTQALEYFTQTPLCCYELLILGLWILLTREKRVYLSVMPVYFTTLYDSYIIIPSMDLLCLRLGSSYGFKRQVNVTRHRRSEFREHCPFFKLYM